MDIAALTTALETFEYEGTEITFSALVINLNTIETSEYIYFASTTTIPLVSPLPVEAFADLNAAIDMYCAGVLGLPQSDVEITIWLQDEITLSG